MTIADFKKKKTEFDQKIQILKDMNKITEKYYNSLKSLENVENAKIIEI